jgi:hypothetical protein
MSTAARAQVADVKNYITPDGLQRLRDERRFLLTRERPAVTQVVAWATGGHVIDRVGGREYRPGVAAVIVLGAAKRDDRDVVEPLDTEHRPALVAHDDRVTRGKGGWRFLHRVLRRNDAGTAIWRP